jgi:hypothetical protein
MRSPYVAGPHAAQTCRKHWYTTETQTWAIRPYLNHPVAPSVIAARTVASTVVPERHFPLTVVIGHGLFAVATLTLVLLTAFGEGGG